MRAAFHVRGAASQALQQSQGDFAMHARPGSDVVDRDRRQLLTTAMGIAAAGATSLFPTQAVPMDTGDAIRTFRVNIPEEALIDLRRRIAATRFPDRETVNDRSQGVQLSKFQDLMRYWGAEYDWRK